MKPDTNAWVARWLDGVADGSKTMSQRQLTAIEANGGAAIIRKAAKARGVHLVLLTDDRGVELVAASKHPFKVLC